MSYTLRGRHRVAARGARCCRSPRAARSPPRLHRWWPLELCGADGRGRRRARPAALPPAASLPAGLGRAAARRCSSSGSMLVLVRALGLEAPLVPALALFAGCVVRSRRCSARRASRCCGCRMRRTAASSGALGVVVRRGGRRDCSRAPAATGGAGCRPTVHLSAGVHQGPLVIDRRERLVGEPRRGRPRRDRRPRRRRDGQERHRRRRRERHRRRRRARRRARRRHGLGVRARRHPRPPQRR